MDLMADQRRKPNPRVLVSPLAVDEPKTPPPNEQGLQNPLEKTGTWAVIAVLILSLILLLLSRIGIRS